MTEASRTLTCTDLRTAFAARLSDLYGSEVPAYQTLLQTCREVNNRVLERDGQEAERLGKIDRVTAERHGAIRVGTPQEMAQVTRIFAALGMRPCGFYDLRDAHPRPIPVVSTAFRPLERDELAANPFRVFTSMLVPEDRRFFDSDMERRLKNFLGQRTLFPEELLRLADRAQEFGELAGQDAHRFLELATQAFALSPSPVDRSWYEELDQISSVAADIGGVASTHINHLTPRVLDIDDLYESMAGKGIEMIDQIQGPPRWAGPDVLLRQTSFRALAEPRRFRERDGTVSEDTLRVRFGEVEARGIALTPQGRDLYDQLVAEADRRLRANPDATHEDVAPQVWAEGFPATERALALQGLAFFTYERGETARNATSECLRALETGDVRSLIEADLVVAKPIVYEDFLPRSAAGIFASNLSGSGSVSDNDGGAPRDLNWMSAAIGADVSIPEDVYAAESQESVARLQKELLS